MIKHEKKIKHIHNETIQKQLYNITYKQSYNNKCSVCCTSNLVSCIVNEILRVGQGTGGAL